MGGPDAAWDDGATATVECYSAQTRAWRPCAPLSTARGDPVCGVVGGSLVVAGGMGTDGRLTSVEAYSAATGGWAPLPSMPHDAYQAASCVLDGRLYVVGGMNSRRVQCWDGERWTVRAELPAERCFAACGASGGKMVLIGGMVKFRSSASVLLYDPLADAWHGRARPCRRLARSAGRSSTLEGSSWRDRASPEKRRLRFQDGEWSEILDIAGGPVRAILTPGSFSAAGSRARRGLSARASRSATSRRNARTPVAARAGGARIAVSRRDQTPSNQRHVEVKGGLIMTARVLWSQKRRAGAAGRQDAREQRRARTGVYADVDDPRRSSEGRQLRSRARRPPSAELGVRHERRQTARRSPGAQSGQAHERGDARREWCPESATVSRSSAASDAQNAPEPASPRART